MRGLGLEGAMVSLLDDPPVPGAADGRWWPPVMLDARWIREHSDDFDLMHLHFGFESLSPDALADAISALRATRRPLVYTVHDLSHPQLNDQAPYDAQLDLLVPAADGLITLTSAAHRQIQQRWGRSALVVPHPAMSNAAVSEGSPDGPVTIGVHLRDLRPNIDAVGTIATLLAAIDRLGAEVRVAVFLHLRVRDEAARYEVRRLCAADPRAYLVERSRPSDHELESQLDSLSTAVLPYGHGTHSGWLELCWDRALPTAVPGIGCFADQHCDEDQCSFAPLDPHSLAAALSRLLTLVEARPGSRARRRRAHERVTQRLREAATIRSGHRALYDAALRGASPARSGAGFR